MQRKGTEKDRIVGKEQNRRAENGREQTETDGDRRRMFENKFYITGLYNEHQTTKRDDERWIDRLQMTNDVV